MEGKLTLTLTLTPTPRYEAEKMEGKLEEVQAMVNDAEARQYQILNIAPPFVQMACRQTLDLRCSLVLVLGQNTSRIQNKGVYGTLHLQGNAKKLKKLEAKLGALQGTLPLSHYMSTSFPHFSHFSHFSSGKVASQVQVCIPK